MIDIEEINEQIERIEGGESSWECIEKLSWLYTVRNQLANGSNSRSNELDRETLDEDASEFLRACSGLNPADVHKVLDEHFAVIKELYPREYTTIVNRLKNLAG